LTDRAGKQGRTVCAYGMAGVSFVDAADGVPILRTGDYWEIGCGRLIVILFGKIHEKVKPSVYSL
jgi:hypothetical protein